MEYWKMQEVKLSQLDLLGDVRGPLPAYFTVVQVGANCDDEHSEVDVQDITVLFPGPCTCTILQYLSPKLQTAITHSILNRFLSFLGCGLAFIYTKCMQIYRV